MDVGCGSGGYLTFPLILSNPEKDIYGIDIAEDSINYAKKCATILGIDENRFICNDIKNWNKEYDCVICSEVIEHIVFPICAEFIENLKKKVKDGGFLIITVPNGSGSYERGYSISHSRKMGHIYRILSKIIYGDSSIIFKPYIEKHRISDEFCMTLSDSEHVNFFTKEDIISYFEDFKCVDFGGSNRWSGCWIPLIPNFQLFLRFNNYLGDINPKKASGFYFLFQKNFK